jgi:hypothetical protein
MTACGIASQESAGLSTGPYDQVDNGEPIFAGIAHGEPRPMGGSGNGYRRPTGPPLVDARRLIGDDAGCTGRLRPAHARRHGWLRRGDNRWRPVTSQGGRALASAIDFKGKGDSAGVTGRVVFDRSGCDYDGVL